MFVYCLNITVCSIPCVNLHFVCVHECICFTNNICSKELRSLSPSLANHARADAATYHDVAAVAAFRALQSL